MTKRDAISILTQATAALVMNRADHEKIKEALATISQPDLVQVAEPVVHSEDQVESEKTYPIKGRKK